jgi:ferredoxin
MKVTVDRDLCIGAADCVRLAPGTFELDDEDRAVVVDPEPQATDRVRLAESSCPTGAIWVES